MNPSFVRKRVGAYDCFVGRNGNPRDGREHAAGWVELFELKVGNYGVAVLPYMQRYGQFFERRIPGSLTDSVNGAFNLARPGVDSRQ